jgi:hypothetical protein
MSRSESVLWESRAYRLYFRVLFVKFYGSFKLVPFFYLWREKSACFKEEASAAEIQLESASEANIIFMHDFLSDLFGLLCVACVVHEK